MAETAARQHGVITLAQLLEAGLSKDQVYARVERGWLHRLSAGVFAVGHPQLGPDGRRLAAVLSCGDGALLSHFSAARAWGLLDGGGARFDVLVRHESGGVAGSTDVRRRHTRRLLAEDRDVLRGVPITSVPRTLLDMAGERRGRYLRHVVHEAEVCGLLDVAAVLRAIELHPRRRGTRLLRAALGVPAPDPTNSRFARRFARLCAQHGLPAPKLGVFREFGGQLRECDAVFDEARFIVELDGEHVHRTRRNFHGDRRRDSAAAAEGWLVIRLTWERVTREAPQVAAEVRQILALRTPQALVAPDSRR